ncbi:hypothetical protein PsorP6_006545 [Peronosclerospora sorghi]|uniref:Uncharacterized protein n=1 Tax=Peronosclerospora sorghi TaxID=230839 RepID=A0ACC0W4C2_9STRA|nr:hypothetical protein PsorP6_006545 [Peronosclerospora sorghi]
MTRNKILLAFLILLATFLTSSAFDWTFWNDSDDDRPSRLARIETDARAATTSSTPTSTPSSSRNDTLSASLDALIASAPSSLTLHPNGTATFLDTSHVAVHKPLAKATEATSQIVSRFRNWVGPRAGSPENGCYRETHFMATCPRHFHHSDDLTHMCWAECPLAYPIRCGFECVRQNDDCFMEALNKVGAIANTVLAAALVSGFTKLLTISKPMFQSFECAAVMIGTMRSVIRYVRTIQTADPTATTDKILTILYQSHNVVTDLPLAYHLCARIPLPRSLDWGARLMSTMNWILLNAIAYKDDIFSSWDKFRAFLIGANFTEAANKINETDIGTLSDALTSESSCGYELRALTDRTWTTVRQLRAEYPGISKGELRLKMQDTQLVQSDIAIATNNCMEQLIRESDEATAYRTRETIRTAFSGMINQLIKKGKSDNGTSEDAHHFFYTAFSKTLISFAVTGLDLVGVFGTVVTYLQPICGPTEFIGEIDDGTDPKTLGLTTVQKAFKGSSMSWTRKGDGAVLVDFDSTDTKNVTVNVFSGGIKIDEVRVHAGESVRWTSNVTTLAGKTLYFDRWRSGFLGLPSKKGGSLLLWIPTASEGGHLELKAKISVT